MHSGWNDVRFKNIYSWAISLMQGVIMDVVVAFCSTSPIIHIVVYSVHVLQCSGLYFSAMNSATSPIASSNTYDFVMDASSLAILFTYIFGILFILSLSYIYHVCMNPHTSNSSTMCTTMCDMILKKLGDI